MTQEFDAVVVGSGPNGLAAAVTLSAAGLRVLVVEGADSVGGGCRTEELTLPGFRHDVCSIAHPLAAGSSFFRRFDLPGRGVSLLHPEVVFAQPLDGGRAGIAYHSLDRTAAGLGPDRATYRRMFRGLVEHSAQITDWVFSAQRRPPSRPDVLSAYALAGLRPAISEVRRFKTAEARGLFAGVAAHAMRPLETAPTAGIGLLLTFLAHSVGWPVVEGGSARLVDALVAALQAGGGKVQTGWWVKSLQELPTSRAVLLDVSPRQLLAIVGEALPSGYRRALSRYRYGSGICKVDFALAGPVPWTNEHCRSAGTLHLGGSFEEVAASEREVAAGHHPKSPYVLTVQPGAADGSRAPQGKATLWAYSHVPAGSDVDVSDRIERQIERFAPGFRDLILAKAVRTAAEQERYDPNCVGGDIACGLQDLRQSFARPLPRWDPYRTPARGVYLCSAATTPGPGVHGRCGELAARAALRQIFGITEQPELGVNGRLSATASETPHGTPDRAPLLNSH
ncbi:MAG: NAD(P)/FAD-dependent oxidoreductase [Candidatus Dormiibacterota bacterium]